MRALVFVVSVFCFTMTIFTLSAEARKRTPPPKFEVVCNCFASTIENLYINYFGHTYGWGDTEADAKQDAISIYNCAEKPSILRERGANWVSIQHCETL